MKRAVAAEQSPRASCWPDELESLLLQAGLCEKSRAIAAWKEFCGRIDDIEDLAEGCYRLLPLVAGNLQDCREPIPHRDRLLGVLRHAWFKNQQLLARTIPFLSRLQEAQIDFLLLKGAALADYYRQQGAVRSMVDIDFLVQPEEVEKALTLLRQLDCRPRTDKPVEQLRDLVHFRHELTLDTPTGAVLDMHWYLVSDARHPEAQEELWRGAVPCALGSLGAKTLNRADQLLHACLHGAVWNDVSPVRWLADSVMLIRAGIDGSRLEAQARRLEHLQPVRETLLLLDSLDIGLPPALVEHWRAMEPTRLEQSEGGYRTRAPNSRERTRHLAWVFLRLHRGESLGKILRCVPAYMKQLHHFRAYSRRAAFLFYLLALALTQSSRPAKVFRTWATR